MRAPSKGPMYALLHSAPPALQQAASDPRLRRRLVDTHSKSRTVSCGVTAPFSRSWCTRFCCALQESISPSCVSSGSSMVGLVAISSKRAYATPGSAAPRAPVPGAGHRQPAPPQELPRHSSVSVSVGSLGPGAHKVCLSPLSISGGDVV